MKYPDNKLRFGSSLMMTFVTIVICTPATTLDPRPRGIFIQVSSANTWVLPQLDKWLQNICKRNKEVGLNNSMNDLVLQDIASETLDKSNYTTRFDVLDIVTPYLPGGSKQCFGNVFVGTIEIKWKGRGSLYKEGIQDSEFRQKNIDYSKAVAKEFLLRYPKIRPINWYVTFESNLNFLIDDKVKDGYQKYLTDLVGTLISHVPGSIMWSPAFWSTWSSTTETDKSKLGSNLENLFRSVKIKAYPGINWMNFQDSVGKSKCTGFIPTPEDAVQWYRFLGKTFTFQSLQLNEELFYYPDYNCEITGTNATTQIQREKFYSDQGIRLGAAFEIRYWRERNLST